MCPKSIAEFFNTIRLILVIPIPIRLSPKAVIHSMLELKLLRASLSPLSHRAIDPELSHWFMFLKAAPRTEDIGASPLYEVQSYGSFLPETGFDFRQSAQARYLDNLRQLRVYEPGLAARRHPTDLATSIASSFS